MSKTRTLLRSGWHKFRAAKSGGVIIYVAFGLPLLLGAMALSVDLGRAFILNTELKDFSDAAALAGAAELDGRNGARAAARSAARTGLQGTLVNVQAFATDGDGPNIAIAPDDEGGIVFLRNLPADGTDFTPADTATSDADARFIFVKVVDRNVRAGLSRAVSFGLDFDTSAKSIAGFSAVVCRVPAMMFCNPLEDAGYAGTTLGCDLADAHYGPPSGGKQSGWEEHEDCVLGVQILMKTAGNGASYTPGEFGLLDPPTGNQGAKAVAELIATAAPDFCIAGTADFRTGEAMGPVVNAINTRFDMYKNFSKSNSDYRPPLNVTKGHDGAGCNTDPAADPAVAMSYPRDACFDPSSASHPCYDGRFGDGNWYTEPTPGDPSSEPYWSVNHPTASPPATADGDAKNYSAMTRYEVYRHEIETDSNIVNNLDLGPNPPAPLSDPSGPGVTHEDAANNSIEEGFPSCYTGGEFSDPIFKVDADDEGPHTYDRRMMRMAVVNCVANAPLQGNEDDVPVIGWVEMFLTEPAEGQGNDKADIYGEVAKVAKAGLDGLKDIVQLYR